MLIQGLDKLRLSHSSRKKLNDGCQQQFYFYKFFKQPRNSMMDSYAGMVGKALHKGWQSYLTEGDRDKAIGDMLLDFDIRCKPGKYEARTLEACYITLESIMDFTDNDVEYSLAYIEHAGEKKPAVEIPFEIVLLEKGQPFKVGGIPVTYIGYIDALMVSNLSGKYKIRDLKTHRWWQDDLSPRWKFDEQILSYNLVIEAVLQNKLHDFEVDYLATFVDVSKPSVWVYPYTKTQEDVQDWAKGLYIDLMNLRMYSDMNWFPRKGNHCLDYGGELCRYWDVCKTRDVEYYKKYFDLGRKLEFVEKEFEPWFTVNLELVG